MIACVSPSDRDFMETLNTLKYANRVSTGADEGLSPPPPAATERQVIARIWDRAEARGPEASGT